MTHTHDVDPVRVRRAYKFQVRSTAHQAAALAACLEDHRQLYNAALQERRDAYRMRSHTVRYGDQSARLKDIRRAGMDGQRRWSFSSQQATLRRLDKAMAAFFRRAKAGSKPGYPRLKGAGWFDTVDWPRDGDGCRWDSRPHEPAPRVHLQGVGHVKVNQHRAVLGAVKTISVKREGRRWYVEVEPRNTSRECSHCGHIAKGNRLTQAEFRCLACGHAAHADANAALNILRAGLVLHDAQAA